MDEMIEQMLKLTAMGNFRADESVARQAVMNHTTTAHFMDMSFVRDSTQVSAAEAYAMQGLAMAQLPAQVAGVNASARVG